MFTLVRLRRRSPFPESAVPAPNMAIPAVIYLAAAALCFGWEFSGRLVLEGNVVAPWLLPPLSWRSVVRFSPETTKQNASRGSLPDGGMCVGLGSFPPQSLH